ncbi:AAA family ATPase [Thauera sp. 2A1]|uniref:NACHT and WD repeat domain-containing protein n=1 Tax=Thauera sp. 2A1 TaxID=2570191 RepID=UPI0012923C16|nr:AAA family ATPase [Thauera sp. 2A1]KAI5915419.1 hypothetical protein GH664_07760 [Thauera sp. 2A1]
MATASDLAWLSGSPYPGLRPFEAGEAHLFFGREQQIDALLERLGRSRFVAVVGESGAGKSSLVRAGLLPALEAGFLAVAGSDWRVVLMRPGGAPIDALAAELVAPGVLSGPGGIPAREFAAAELRRGPLGLVQLVADARLEAHANVLVVVDQFEELFRYSTVQRKDEANAFVELLLRAAAQRELAIHVVLTMRSDFIGACARFRGLPEALNDNQFLTPRLTREQVGMAIRGPARVFGGDVEELLVAELENEVGDDPDQLPLLQHLLLRLWQHAPGTAAPVLSLTLYRELGGFRGALDQHAEQIHAALSSTQQHVAEHLFKCLTGGQPGRRDIRRPVAVGEAAAVAGVEPAALIEVVEAFRAPGRHFLMPPLAVPLGPDTQLDISHESLIRQWQRLHRWVEDESADARDFLGLRDEALRWRAGEGELLGGRDLLRALDWRERAQPTQAWAMRYAAAEEFDATLSFIGDSEREDRRLHRARQEALEREAATARHLRRLSSVLGVALVACLIVGGIAFSAFVSKREAERKATAEKMEKVLAQARSSLFRQPDLALADLLDVVRDDPENERAVMALRAAVAANVSSVTYRGVQRLLNISASGEFWLGFALGPDSFSPDGGRVVIPTEKGAVIHDIFGRPDIALDGHTDIVGSARFSPDGRLIVTTSGDGTARLWDAASGGLLHVLQHAAAVNSAVFDRSGQSLVTATDPAAGSGKGEVVAWDVASGRRRPLKAMEYTAEDVRYAGFSPDGRRILAVGRTGHASVWDAATGRAVRELELVHADSAGTRDPRASSAHCEDFVFVKAGVTYSPDHKWITLLDQDGRATLFDAATLRRARWQLPADERFCALDWSHDGTRIAGASTDGVVQVWDVQGGDRLRVFPRRPEVVLSVAFHPHDRDVLLTASSDRAVRLWTLGTGEGSGPVQLLVLRGHKGAVGSAVFSPDARYVLSAADDGTARLWTLTPAAPLLAYDDRQGDVAATVIAAGTSAQALLPLLARGNRLRLEGQRAEGAAPAGPATASDLPAAGSPLPDGLQLSLRGAGDRVVRWDVGAGRFNVVAAVSGAATADHRFEHLIAADGQQLAVFDRGRLVGLHALTAAAAPSPSVPRAGIEYRADICDPAALSRDGRQVAFVCSESERFHYIDVVRLDEAGARTQRLPLKYRATLAAFDPEGKRLALALDSQTVVVADLVGKDGKTGNGIEIAQPFSGQITDVNDLRFNDQGTMLATSSYDGTVRVWDADTGRQLAVMRPPETPRAVRFDASGREVLILTRSAVLRWECPVCGSAEDLIDAGRRLLGETR